MEAPETHAFDLDGTITNTMATWLGIYGDNLRDLGLAVPPDEELAKHTHDWRQMLTLGVTEEQLPGFITQATSRAAERLPDAPLFPGAYDTLSRLRDRGARVAIFSTMDRPILEPAMQHNRLYDITKVAIAGTDVKRRKPYPDGLHLALSSVGTELNDYRNATYTGDKDTDIKTAHNATVKGVLFFPPEHDGVYNYEALLASRPMPSLPAGPNTAMLVVRYTHNSCKI